MVIIVRRGRLGKGFRGDKPVTDLFTNTKTSGSVESNIRNGLNVEFTEISRDLTRLYQLIPINIPLHSILMSP